MAVIGDATSIPAKTSIGIIAHLGDGIWLAMRCREASEPRKTSGLSLLKLRLVKTLLLSTVVGTVEVQVYIDHIDISIAGIADCWVKIGAIPRANTPNELEATRLGA